MPSGGIGQGTFPYRVATFDAPLNDTLQINLKRELESYQKKGGLFTYVKAMLFEITLTLAGNLSTETDLAGWEFNKLVRSLYFENWAHDIRLTGEYLQFWPWYNESRYPTGDAADVPNGDGDAETRKLLVVLPFYDQKLEDPRTLMDPIERYLDLSPMLNLTFAPDDYFDGTMKITNPKVTMKVLLEKSPKKWQAPPFTWRYEDRTENPFLINYNGVIHSHVLFGAVAKQVRGIGAITDTQVTIEPLELSRPNTPPLDYIQNWEWIHKMAASPDDAASAAIASRYMDWQSGTVNVIPLINRSEDLVLQHSQQPVFSGQTKFTVEPPENATHRSYIRYVAPNETKHEEEAKKNFADPGASVKRPNPGDRKQPLFVANTTRVLLGPQTMSDKDKVQATAKKLT